MSKPQQRRYLNDLLFVALSFWFIEGENNLNQEYQTLWLSFDIYILAWASHGESIASS